MLDDKVSKGWVAGLWIAASVLISISALTSIWSLISMGKYGSPVFWPMMMVIIVSVVGLMAVRMTAEQIHTVFQTHESLETFIYHQQSQLRTMEQKLDRVTNMLDSGSMQVQQLVAQQATEQIAELPIEPLPQLRTARPFQTEA